MSNSDAGRVGRRTLLVGSISAAALSACGGERGASPDAPDSVAPATTSGTAAPSATAPSARSVPAPAGFVRTSWSTDPFASGSYSFLPVGAEPAMRASLSAPIDERVFFAGEATDPSDPSTVHGALASGRRAADEVLAVAAAGEQVVVVGAGASGAQVARLLADAGVVVTVVEARDRVGGRLDTVQPVGWTIPVERGASWVHAIETHDLADRLAGLGVAMVPFDYEASALGVDGERIDDVEAFVDGIEDAVAGALEWASDRDDDRSIADAVVASGEIDRVDPLALQYAYDSALTTEYGADPDELSAWWGLEEGSDGEDLLVIGRYAALVEALLEGLDVRLEAPVVRIAHDDTGVELVVRESGAEASVRADRVVVTVPLGVLKSGVIEFEPALDAPRQQAIDAIGMGLLDKLWLRFDEQFWSDETLMWSIVGGDGYAEWFNLAPVTGAPVLMALVGGDRARELAARSDDDAVATALSSLQLLIDAGW